jgi:membrane-bound lytic murein transglycosylase D
MLSRRRHCLTGLAIAFGALASACAAHVAAPPTKASGPAAVIAAPPVPAPQPAPDPIVALIAVSHAHFEAGQRNLQEGHLETAKTEFNRALDVLLESSYGARTEPRLREHFDRLVERISAYELVALAQGDGFTEKKYEPASLDDLLAVSPSEEPAPTPETTQAVTEDLQETVHDIDIPLNEKVLSYVELFSGRLKAFIEEGLNRGLRFLPMIQQVFRAEGLPLDLAYVPLIESAFKPNAVSRAKAKGVWQFMPGTALENGLKQDWYIDERADIEKATRAAAKYLKTLHKMFGDWHLALASYNGGPGRVQRAIKRSGRDDFWKLTATTKYLPRETRNYVPLILAAVIVARNPAQYGLNANPLELPVFERVWLPAAVDLRRIAEWTGTPAQVIQDLNPELRRWTTPIRSTDYELKVPEGTAELIMVKLAETPIEELVSLSHHTVKKGENLLSIAKKFKVSRTDLAEANYLSAKAPLNAGQQLIIPRAPTTLLAARPDNPAPFTPPASGDAVVASNVVPPDIDASDQAKVTHHVKPGETLFSIAKLYRTTVTSLRQWNGIRGDAIQAGQRLTIFKTTTVATH